MPNHANTPGSFMTAFVEIQANVVGLKQQMEEVKKTVKDTAKDSEDNFKKHTIGIEKAVEHMATNIKRLLLGAGVIGSFTLLGKEAMRNQDAIFLLSAALKTSGNYSKAAMMEFMGFADVLQDLTTHSNEQILTMMRLQHSMGVTADRLKITTVMALGLADALDMDYDSASKYMALAMEGEFRMLSRYIPALKTVNTEQEKLAILHRFATDAFEISGAKAITASGSYKQLKNTLQDTAVAIGTGLLPVFTETAIQIKTWAEDNTDKIAYWANMFFAYVGFVKDVIIDLVMYMKSDFSSGVKTSFSAILILAAGFADAFVLICGNAATRAYHLFITEFGGNLGKWLISIAQPQGILGKAMGISPIVAAGRIGLMAAGEGLISEAGKEREVAALGPQLEKVAKDTSNIVQTIFDNSGVYMVDSSEKLKTRLLEIKTDQSKRLIDIEKNTITETKKLVATLGALTVSPWETREAREAKRQMEEKLIDMQAELDLAEKIGLSWYKSKETLDLQVLAIKASAGNAKLYADYMEKVDFTTQQQEINQRWNEFGRNLQGSIENAFDGIMKRGENFRDFMINMARAVIEEWVKMQFIKPASEFLSRGLTAGVEGLTNIIAGVAHSGGDVGNLPTTLVPAHAFAGARKYHGLGPNEQAIIAEKGETISRKGATPPIVLNLNLNAIDAQSGVAFLSQNQQVLTNLFNKAIRQNDRSVRG